MNALIPLSRMRVSRIAAACLCAFLLSACDKSMPPDQLVSEARAAIARNDLQTASIQLKNALQQDANFGPARFELGKVNLRLGDTAAAVKELQRAMDLDHDASDALRCELQDHVKSVIAPYKYPREVVFVPQLPRTETGKLQRFALRQQATQQH